MKKLAFWMELIWLLIIIWTAFLFLDLAIWHYMKWKVEGWMWR